MVSKLESLAALREQVRRLGRSPAPVDIPRLSTGSAPLDRMLGGGLPRGRIVEISGAWSSGKTALALTAVAQVTRSGRLCAYVDARRELYPPAAAALGVDLVRLLVVRPTAGSAAIARAGEIVARSQSFPLILLDLPDGARLNATATGRLRAAASGMGVTIVALTPLAGAVECAALELEVAGHRVRLHKGGAWIDRAEHEPFMEMRETPELKVVFR